MPDLKKEIVINDHEMYKELLDGRGVDSIKHHSSYSFNKAFINEPFAYREHVWAHGDRLIKLSIKYYGDPDYWWVIGLYNAKPTDAHMKMGDVIRIPFPILDVYRSMI